MDECRVWITVPGFRTEYRMTKDQAYQMRTAWISSKGKAAWDSNVWHNGKDFWIDLKDVIAIEIYE